MKKLKRHQQTSEFVEKKRTETVIIVDVLVPFMKLTSVHDLKPNRFVETLEGTILRSYPLSMRFARNRWIPIRHVILADSSGWVIVKVWGSVATELLRHQRIRIESGYCFEQNGSLCVTIGIHARLMICTQA